MGDAAPRERALGAGRGSAVLVAGPPPPRVPLPEALILQAEAVLADTGVQGFTIEEVIRRSGTHAADVTEIVTSAHDLLDALFVHGFRNFAENDIEPSDDAVGDILRGFEMYRAWALANPVYYQLMFVSRLAGYEPSPSAGSVGWKTFEVLAIRVGRAVEEGHLEGNPLDVTLDLWSTVHGSVMLELAGPGIFEDQPGARFSARMRRVLDGFRPGR